MSAENKPLNVIELLALRETSTDQFESLHPPDRMGNAAAIAYGGCTLGVAANAACLTAPPGFHPYTLQGNFMGPAFIDRTFQCQVTRLRDTRTFVTRLVQVSQRQNDGTGTSRVCLTMLADFHAQEAGSAMVFSAPPRGDWGTPDQAPTMEQACRELVDAGRIDESFVRAANRGFGLGMRLFDLRFCRGSIFTQNLLGVAKHVATTQDHLSVTDKISADWLRSRVELKRENEHVAALVSTHQNNKTKQNK
jgi:acyl-CoA thioesterase